MADEGYLVDGFLEEGDTQWEGVGDTHLCYFCTVYLEIAIRVRLVAVMFSLVVKLGKEGQAHASMICLIVTGRNVSFP